MRKSSHAAIAAAALSALILAVAVVLGSSGVLPPKLDAPLARTAADHGISNDARQITAVRDAWIEAINAADARRLVNWYAPGAVLFPTGSPVRLGAGAIARWHSRWWPAADAYLTLEAATLQIEGNLALEEWSVEVTITPRGPGEIGICGDPLQFQQHGVRIYRKDFLGNWRIDREVWSPDHPAVARLVALGTTVSTATVC